MTEREVLAAWQERRGIEQELLRRSGQQLVPVDESPLRQRLAIIHGRLKRELKRRTREKQPIPEPVSAWWDELQRLGAK